MGGGDLLMHPKTPSTIMISMPVRLASEPHIKTSQVQKNLIARLDVLHAWGLLLCCSLFSLRGTGILQLLTLQSVTRKMLHGSVPVRATSPRQGHFT